MAHVWTVVTLYLLGVGVVNRCFLFVTIQLFSSLTFSVKMCPEAERMFGDTYSVKGRQPFDIRALRDGRNV